MINKQAPEKEYSYFLPEKRGSVYETTPKASTTLDDSPKIKSSLTVRERNFQKCIEVELQE